MKKFMGLSLGAMVVASVLGACVPKEVKEESLETSVAVETDVDKKESNSDEATDKKIPTIAIVQLMDHTSLNIIHNAIMSRLEELGYKNGEGANIIFKNAQGELSNVASIMKTLEGSKPDVIVPITTPVAQAAMGLAKTTPVVFTAVTDPIKAGVVTDFDKTDKGMTGTSDIIQVDKILDLARQITPNIKNIGYIYNAGEDNSVSNLAKLEDYAKEHELEIVKSSITTSSELQSAASTMVEKVDAIFVANDNTVAEAMPILMSVANKAKKPVYVGADSMVMDGGFATVGIDYNDLGKETANIVDEILKGKKTSEIPVKVFKDNLNIYINTDTAKEIGIEIPKEILENERYVEITNNK